MGENMRDKIVATCICALASLTLSPTKAAAEAGDNGFVATKITTTNAAQYVQSGPDAIGGIGDWFLSNGTLCIIVAGLENEGDFSPRGGTLRDIGFCDRADDQFVSQQDLLDGSLAYPVAITDIRAATGPASAAITTLGSYRGLMIETEYSINKTRPQRIGVQKRIWRHDDDAPDPSLIATATLNYESMPTFLMNTQTPQHSNGFAQEKFVGRGILSYTTTARPVDTVMMMSPHDMAHPVSYAMRRIAATLHSEGARHALPAFALADSSALAFLTLPQPFSIGDGSRLGLMQLLQVPFMGVALGDTIHLEDEILVVPSADVAAFTDRLFPDAPLLTGRLRLNGRPARVHIDLADGTPFSQITPDEKGRFALHLPIGEYQLRVLSAAADPYSQPVSVPADGVNVPDIDLPRVARIALPRGGAMRLAFRGDEGTQDPHFEDPLTGYQISDEDGVMEQRRVSDVHLSGAAGDPTHVYLADGDYTVYAVRGPEYEVSVAGLKIRNGENQTLRISPPARAVTTAGHISADMHVHAASSFDTAFPAEKRVRTFIAEHGEVMVAAEHDTIFDFTPVLRAMGVSDKMIAITGSEVTSTQRSVRAPYSIGHMNFFPLRAKPHAHKRGLPNHENRRTRDVLYDMHVHFDDPIAQLNHPRDNPALSVKNLPDDFEDLIGDEEFFDHMGVAAHPYNPHRPLTTPPNNSLIDIDPISGHRDIDFDVMEIMNGTQDYRPERVATARQDWLSLVAQGETLAASANSDSHNKWQQVALPRNMVRVGRDTIVGFSLPRFVEAVRRGAFYGTTGPFIDLRLGRALIGDTHKGRNGVLKGRIYSSSWAAAESLRVQVNGKTVYALTLPADGTFEIPLNFTADAFVTIEAVGQAGKIYQAVYPGFYPYAYSNPIYVDADGDGQWTPPGIGAAAQ